MSPRTTLSMFRSAVDGFVVAVEAVLGVVEPRRPRVDVDGIGCKLLRFRNCDTQIVFAAAAFFGVAMTSLTDDRSVAKTPPPRREFDEAAGII
jgi:hypothetical protein